MVSLSQRGRLRWATALVLILAAVTPGSAAAFTPASARANGKRLGKG